MNNRFLFLPMIILILTSALSAFAQKVTIIQFEEVPETYALFPRQASETSGLIWFNDDLWTFNDSGGKPELYKIDSLGNIIQTVHLAKAKNQDWEDITQDEQSIFVGDFGNNFGNRLDLCIYRIDKSEIHEIKDSEVDATPIYINYGDQKDFSIRNRKHNYDCESMISYRDSLILFSKNWKDGKTRMYKTGKTMGRYPLEPIEEYNADGLVTGASYNDSNGMLALIGYKDFIPFILIFDNFDGNSFNSENITRINLVALTNSQTEGISWYDEDNILISTEQRDAFQQGAYQLNVSSLLKEGEKIK